MSATQLFPPNRLDELTIAAGLTANGIADRLDVTRDDVIRWGCGADPIPDDAQEELSDLFGVSTRWLMRQESDERIRALLDEAKEG